MSNETTTVRLMVSPQVARIVKPGAPRDAQLAAARGALPLAAKDLLTALLFLCRSTDIEVKKAAIGTLREMPASMLRSLIADPDLHPQLLDLLARARFSDHELMGSLIMHKAVTPTTLLYLAQKGDAPLLERLAGHQNMLMRQPGVVAAILANPAAEKVLKYRLGWREPEPQAATEPEPVAEEADASPGLEEVQTDRADEADPDEEGRSEEELARLVTDAEQEGRSKFQIALDLKVSEKIKMGLTGDKEWRSILIKDSNKLVQGAVMKNPRITEGEVLMVAKNKTSSDELIRSILLNKDWVKNYELKKALVVHPKTPIPKAIRFVSALSLKELKQLAKSRQVSTIIATTARKELELRLKKGGG